MLAMWTDLRQANDDYDDATQQISDQAALDKLLDALHEQAKADNFPHSVALYAGDRFPETGHWEGMTRIPPDPGDGPLPLLSLVVGTTQTPVYWRPEPVSREQASKGAAEDKEPELEYFSGGQHSYAPAWSLIPHEDAREAARQFLATDGRQPANITWQPDEAESVAR